MAVQRGNAASLLGSMGHLAISDIFLFFLVVVIVVFVFVVLFVCFLLVIALYCTMYCIMYSIMYCIIYCIMIVLYNNFLLLCLYYV